MIQLWHGDKFKKEEFIQMAEKLIYTGLKNIDTVDSPMKDEIGYRKYQAIQYLNWLQTGKKFNDDYNAEMLLYRLYSSKIKKIMKDNDVEYPNITPAPVHLLGY